MTFYIYIIKLNVCLSDYRMGVRQSCKNFNEPYRFKAVLGVEKCVNSDRLKKAVKKHTFGKFPEERKKMT